MISYLHSTLQATKHLYILYIYIKSYFFTTITPGRRELSPAYPNALPWRPQTLRILSVLCSKWPFTVSQWRPKDRTSLPCLPRAGRMNSQVHWLGCDPLVDFHNLRSSFRLADYWPFAKVPQGSGEGKVGKSRWWLRPSPLLVLPSPHLQLPRLPHVSCPESQNLDAE